MIYAFYLQQCTEVLSPLILRKAKQRREDADLYWLNPSAHRCSNHFEALTGDRKGQFSIRINQQWRLCFEWSESENYAFNIEVADYH